VELISQSVWLHYNKPHSLPVNSDHQTIRTFKIVASPSPDVTDNLSNLEGT